LQYVVCIVFFGRDFHYKAPQQKFKMLLSAVFSGMIHMQQV